MTFDIFLHVFRHECDDEDDDDNEWQTQVWIKIQGKLGNYQE